ncbi:MAG: phosphatase PAP2 family protein [Candidatus Zambryskibacteria bacterium]
MTLDQTVLNFFVNSRAEWLTFFMMVITYSGSYMLVGGLTFISAISFYFHKHLARIFPLLVTVGGSAATAYIIKHVFYRARPIVEAVYLETGSSFPSGRATMVMALYGFFLYIIWKHDRHYLKKPFMVFLFALIILVGVSRLYLGVHYLSDVLAGYAIGLIWLFIGTKLHKLLLCFEWFKNKLENSF